MTSTRAMKRLVHPIAGVLLAAPRIALAQAPPEGAHAAAALPVPVAAASPAAPTPAAAPPPVATHARSLGLVGGGIGVLVGGLGTMVFGTGLAFAGAFEGTACPSGGCSTGTGAVVGLGIGVGAGGVAGIAVGIWMIARGAGRVPDPGAARASAAGLQPFVGPGGGGFRF
jgi:hypothetical protein